MILFLFVKQRKTYLEAIKARKQAANTEKSLFEVPLQKPLLKLYSQRAKLGEYIEQANVYRAKLEKKQREIKYGLGNPTEINRTNTRNFK